MKAVVFYESAPDITMDRIMQIYPEHQARVDEFANAGKVIGIGPFGNPGEGSMGIFIDQQSAEEFIKEDPFILNGIVAKHTIKMWNDDLL